MSSRNHLAELFDFLIPRFHVHLRRNEHLRACGAALEDRVEMIQELELVTPDPDEMLQP